MIKPFKHIFKSKNSKKTADIDCNVEHVKSCNFLLKYQNDEVGTLCYDGKVWTFMYSDFFKNQSELQPLFEFPKTDKVYKSEDLWPFFKSRIPSEKQPKVQEHIEANPNDKNNLVKLLAVFGNASVNNPYKLINI